MHDEPHAPDWLCVSDSCSSPCIDVGNECGNFGITYGLGTGTGHAGLVERPLPDRPRALWPWVFYDEEWPLGQTLGCGDGALSALVVWQIYRGPGRSPRPGELEELRSARSQLIAFAAGWGDPLMEATVDAVLGGASYAELVELLEPGSVRARAARLAADAPVEAWMELADADPYWLPPLVRAFERDSSLAERVLQSHLVFDCPDDTLERAAAALRQQGRMSSPLWPVAVASEEQLPQAFLEASRALYDSDPLAALHAAANAVTLTRDGWPEGAWDQIVHCALHAHADYRKWLAELREARHPLLADLLRAPGLTVPTAEQLATARPEIAVAWDWLVEQPTPEASDAAPGLAYDRARRLGLDWGDPVQRAVAERALDEQKVRQLIGAPR